MAVSRRLLLAAVLSPDAAAADGPRLEVAGAIAPPAPRWLGLAELDAIAAGELVTRTPWTRGPQRFGGLPLARLLAALGARGERLHAQALNDYAASMPVAAVVEDGGFLATRRGGLPMAVREGGPFWLIFPWSRRPELDTAVHRQRSVWQLRRIEVA